MIGGQAIVDGAGCDVLFDLTIQFKMIFPGKNFDFCPGGCLPLGNLSIEWLILCATDQLYPQFIARKFPLVLGYGTCTPQHQRSGHQTCQFSREFHNPPKIMFAEINLTEDVQILSSVKLDFKIFKNFSNSKFR